MTAASSRSITAIIWLVPANLLPSRMRDRLTGTLRTGYADCHASSSDHRHVRSGKNNRAA